VRIRRKHTNQEIGGSYQYWRDNILSKHVEENYDILSDPDIVDVFETDTKDGSKKYIETTDRYIAIQQYIEKNDIYSIRTTTAKFDNFYRMITKPQEALIRELVNSFISPIIKIETKKAVPNKIQFNMKKFSRIFISHSSKDRKYVAEIIELLETIGVKSNEIFCSSFEGYGIALGEDFLETLKKELNNDILVIFILSNNFYKSPISLCEMGATWVKTNVHIPILIPPFSFEKIKGVIKNTQGIKLDESLQLNLLKENLEKSFNLSPINQTIWESKRNRVLGRINSFISEDKKPIRKNILKSIISDENAIIMLSIYAKENKLNAISFETIIKNVNSKFDEIYLMKLVENNPLDIKRVLLRNGLSGIKLLQR
jgi:hypothetical protein